MLKYLLAVLLLFQVPLTAQADGKREVTMYKRPYCSCCDGHADHLRANGFRVTVIQSENMSLIKKQRGVPQELEGCHTILVDGYVVEGHVPARVIDRLLRERPNIRGISLPGMPNGSPGMGGEKTEPFEIYKITEGVPQLYATD